ncbi:hypothetical protein [Xanthomonas phage JGB6]|nr:hypothetical protein [Xanthomonas phage JGB6]
MSTTEELYDFGEDFEILMLGYMFRDVSFQVRTEGLIKLSISRPKSTVYWLRWLMNFLHLQDYTVPSRYESAA